MSATYVVYSQADSNILENKDNRARWQDRETADCESSVCTRLSGSSDSNSVGYRRPRKISNHHIILLPWSTRYLCRL